MDLIIWLVSNETSKHIRQGKAPLEIVREELRSSGARCNLGRGWAGLNYLFSKLTTESPLKMFLSEGGFSTPNCELRMFSHEEVVRITKIIGRLEIDELRGSVTVKELATNEVYPYREEDNPVRVFSELKRALEELKIHLAYAATNNRGILLEIEAASDKILH